MTIKFRIYSRKINRKHLPKTKKLLAWFKRNKIKPQMVDVTTKKGFQSADRNKIMRLPTVLVIVNRRIVDRAWTIGELRKALNDYKKKRRR